MNKSPVVFIVIVFFLLGLALFFIPNTEKKYKENGIQISVTITDKNVTTYGGKQIHYTGVYEDASGNQVEAHVYSSRKKLSVGDVSTGYYLAESPTHVECFTEGKNPLPTKAFGVGVWILGAAAVIMTKKKSHNTEKFWNGGDNN